MVIVSDCMVVVDVTTKEGTNRQGQACTFYNVVLGNVEHDDLLNCDVLKNRISLGVPELVAKNVVKGEEVRLKGNCGFTREGQRFFYFDEIYLGK